MPDGVAGLLDGDFLTLDPHLTGGVSAQAENAFHQLSALCAHQTGHAQDLALLQLEAAVAERARMDGGEVFHLHHDLVGGVVLQRGIQVGQFAADHLGDDLLFGHVGDVPLTDIMTITHDGDFVGNDLDLVHLMADVDQSDALLFQLVHDAEQGLDFVRSQRGSRLIQDQHLAVCGNSLCNFHHLHLCDAQRTQLCVGVDVQLELFQQVIGIFVHLGMVHDGDGTSLLGGVAAQPDVLGHSTGRDRLQLLMHHRDAAVQCIQRGGDVDLFAFILDLALVHLVNAEHTFHQGGLTGTVLAHQGHDLAGAELQLRVVQRFHAGEGLYHAFHYQTIF